MNAGKYIIIAIIIVVAIGLLRGRNEQSSTASTNAKQIKDEYSKTWVSKHTRIADISVCLSKNHIGGCGEYYVKTKLRDKSEFAVACTADGKNYKYYLVWPNTGGATAISDDGIEKPF